MDLLEDVIKMLFAQIHPVVTVANVNLDFQEMPSNNV